MARRAPLRVVALVLLVALRGGESLQLLRPPRLRARGSALAAERGRLRRAFRWLRRPRAAAAAAAAAPPLTSAEVLSLVVLGRSRADAAAMPPAEGRALLAAAAAGAGAGAAAVPPPPTPAEPAAGAGAVEPPPTPAEPAAAPATEAAAPDNAPLTSAEVLRLVVLGSGRGDAEALDPSTARAALRAAVAGAPASAALPFDAAAAAAAEGTPGDLWESAVSGADAPPRAPAADAAAVDAALATSWPDAERFTRYLTSESLWRLKILGPSFAEPLKREARLRRGLYLRWLAVVDGPGLLPPPAGAAAAPNLDATGGLRAEASDAAKAAYLDLVGDARESSSARADLAAWDARRGRDRAT